MDVTFLSWGLHTVLLSKLRCFRSTVTMESVVGRHGCLWRLCARRAYLLTAVSLIKTETGERASLTPTDACQVATNPPWQMSTCLHGPLLQIVLAKCEVLGHGTGMNETGLLKKDLGL